MKTETQHIITIEWIQEKLRMFLVGLLCVAFGFGASALLLHATEVELGFFGYMTVLAFGTIAGGLIILGLILMSACIWDTADMPEIKVKVRGC